MSVTATQLGVRDQTMKKDIGKPRWDLLPLDVIEGMVKVLTFGASKYADNGWKGLVMEEPNRVKASLMRHLTQIEQGEIYDQESGLKHADHVQCNTMFLAYYALETERRLREPTCGKAVGRNPHLEGG